MHACTHKRTHTHVCNTVPGSLWTFSSDTGSHFRWSNSTILPSSNPASMWLLQQWTHIQVPIVRHISYCDTSNIFSIHFVTKPLDEIIYIWAIYLWSIMKTWTGKYERIYSVQLVGKLPSQLITMNTQFSIMPKPPGPLMENCMLKLVANGWRMF